MPLRKPSLLRRISGSSIKEEKTALPSRHGWGMGDSPSSDSDRVETYSWSTLLPELLGEIIQRVETNGCSWPKRQNVIACAGVCKKWREITKEIVRSRDNCGDITFPLSLKQPGPPDSPNLCFIKRNKKTSTFYLYLSLTPSFNDNDTEKFIMAARRYRRGSHVEYIISLDAHDISQKSNAYVGKLRSDFLGTNYTIYDSQPPHNGAKPSHKRASRRFASKQISPQFPAGNFEVGQVSYKFNLLKSRGPRRMVCSLNCPSSADPNEKDTEASNASKSKSASSYSTTLRNKAPRWHEHLQCWCLNFHGRVTIASVKNFQLASIQEPNQGEDKGDEETILQFGKVGDDTFTMDYKQPLSAFQAFAICLTSFGTKLACE